MDIEKLSKNVMSDGLKPESMSKTWNWHPELPLGFNPYWHWPPKPVSILKWLVGNFLQFSDRVIFLAFAFAVAIWIQPLTQAHAVFSPDWVLLALLRNYIALLVVAGGLHLWFYGIDAQGNRLRYDTRPIKGRKNSLFMFGYQTWDNMFYALAYGAPIATGYEVLARWMYANGHLNMIDFVDQPVWFILMFPLLTLFQNFHFYFVHRLLHWPPLYRQVHSVHHRNVNTGPWSGMSMHPFEHLMYFSTFLIFLVVPSNPVHMVFLLYWQLLGAPSSHSGYEAIWVKDKSRFLVGSFFHQLHHRYYECNYGGVEWPWDKWFGTFHDGSEEATKATRARKKSMY